MARGKGNGPGQPKIYENKDDFLDALWEYLKSIENDGFVSTPTKHHFADWAGIDRRTLFNYLNGYFPFIKKDFEELLAETLAKGAMIGKYNPTMAIFCMKNWCGMTDKQEQKISAEVKGVEEFFSQFEDEGRKY